MARVVILGAGISGHTASTLLRKKLGKEHEVIVISPKPNWNWIPSNIWVGVGLMKKEEVSFPLKPIYDKQKIVFKQGKATKIFPEGDESNSPYVEFEWTTPEKNGQTEKVTYDFLINATGPKLNFGATEGIGPGKHSYSVCSADHATEASKALLECIKKMKSGQKQKFLVGSGHGLCTCQGAAFEYVFNIEYELRRHKVRDLAEITFLTNEYELGDFGIGGAHFSSGGYNITSKIFAESLYVERGIRWIKRAHVQKVENSRAYYETLEGEESHVDFDFAMLLPPFKGQDMQAFSKSKEDITSKLFAPNGFMKVDADYSGKPYEEWKPTDWPKTYQNQDYKNIFAVGIAFAPPHTISKPMKNPKGTPINPTPPRTGMPSGIMGRVVAESIVDMIKRGKETSPHSAPFAEMGVACIASAGASFLNGSAASITMCPIVPDFDQFPTHGRNIKFTFGEIGLAGHWIKRILHHMFIYKAKCKPGWFFIPE
ncbi:MAG: sulfide:quinone reductase [Bdellovibrionaceae bacterium]|nr:sulfide:quinone reductase [Pseudobdellovibrionaceae bacterium]